MYGILAEYHLGYSEIKNIKCGRYYLTFHVQCLATKNTTMKHLFYTVKSHTFFIHRKSLVFGISIVLS